jgi:hypothetical protein
MAQAAVQAATSPSREDFAKLIDESFGDGNMQEGAVVKGTVVAIERDLAVIDVGLKTEGRVALRRARPQHRDQGRRRRRGLSRKDRECARRSRAVARQGAPRGKLGQARKGVPE